MTTFKKIKSFKPGEEITDFFVIRKKELRLKKVDGSPYLALELGNSTGRIAATVWNEVKETTAEYQTGHLIKVLGKVIDYKGGNTLVIEKIRKVVEEDNIKPIDFLPSSKKDQNLFREDLKKIIQSIKNPHLHLLLKTIFSDDNLRQSFENAPAGKLWHHNRISGLIEHSLSIANICDFLATKYSNINRDLLITGALLHDVGKIQSYKTNQGFIDFSDEGRLIGHLSIGANWLNQMLSQIPDFPAELRKQLLHLILSHHGELANGSPVVPMTLEALILFHVDELDSKIDAYQRIAENEKNDEIRWSKFVRLLDRFFYFPPDKEDLDEKSSD